MLDILWANIALALSLDSSEDHVFVVTIFSTKKISYVDILVHQDKMHFSTFGNPVLIDFRKGLDGLKTVVTLFTSD